MIEKDDWRLLNDVEYLKGKSINCTSGAEISQKAKYLKKCVFCWAEIETTDYSFWFIAEDMSCCVCEECYNDFNEMFRWEELKGEKNGREAILGLTRPDYIFAKTAEVLHLFFYLITNK